MLQTRNERLVWSHLLTPRGWMLGAIRVPAGQSLLRFLNGPGRLLHLAEVVAGGWAGGGAPMSVRRDQVTLLVPQADERVAPAPSRGRGARYRASLLFARGQLTGLLEVRKGLSPASFLERAPRFVVLEGGRLRFPGSRLPTGTTRAVIVNAGAVVAFGARREEAGAEA